MTDRVVEALRQIAPVARDQVTVKGEGEVCGGRILRRVESGTGTTTVVMIGDFMGGVS